MSEKYPRVKRITRTSEFHLVHEKGKRIRAAQLDVRSIASPSGHIRLGIIVARYGHTAVLRNRLKRQVRDLGRRLIVPLRVSCEVVIRCRVGAYELSFDQLQTEIEKIASQLATAYRVAE